MTAAPADRPEPGPEDSLEVRWILPGVLGTAMREWFGRFPAGTETRQDTYLLQPHLPGLSVKLRADSALEVKSYLGSPGILALPGRGRLESWRKWSFPYDAPDRTGAVPAGWINVRKRRRGIWFPFAVSQDPVPIPKPAAGTGCTVELTEARVRDEPWWTVGFEAAGSVGQLRGALQHAADQMFARPLPSGVVFSLDNSRSYTQWLNGRSPPR